MPGFVGGRVVATEKADSGRSQHTVAGGSGRSHGGHSSVRAESICRKKCPNLTKLQIITNYCLKCLMDIIWQHFESLVDCTVKAALISLGQTKSDNINRKITISGNFYLVMISKWDV